VIADPLSAPAVKLIVAEVSPAVMDVIVGAAGAVGSAANAANAASEAANKSAYDNGTSIGKIDNSLTFVAPSR